MPKKILFGLAGIGIIFVFVVFSYIVHKNHFTALDFNTTVRLQDHTPRRVDGIFSLLSEIGKFEVMTVVLVGLFLVTRRLKAGIVALGFYVVFHLIEIYGKFFVHHPPPPQFMLRTQDLIPLSPFEVRTQNSYPSGHAGRALFLTVIALTMIWQTKRLSFMVKSLLTIAILGYDGLLLYSRVYLGEHWLSDVIGGAILGTGLGLLAAMFIQPLIAHPTTNHEKRKGFFPKYKIEIKKVE